jgi:hypothetical protein
MGCDIHAYPERRTSNGTWVPVGPMPKEVFDAVYPWIADEPKYAGWHAEWTGDEPHKWYMRRNYNFFARLADVRNWYDERVEPLYPNRGVPADASPEVAAHCEWIDAHSHTWATLRELMHEALVAAADGEWYRIYLNHLMLHATVQSSGQLDLDSVRVTFIFDN